MFRLNTRCTVVLLVVHVGVHLAQEVEIFTTEKFLSGSDLNSGLYNGEVKGRRRFEETQVPHGFGSIFYFTNDRLNRHNYTGYWVDGNREGNGTTNFKDGSVYVGEYRNSLEDGNGSIMYSNGNKLEAEFRDGQIQGHGVYRYANGDQREGFFSDNVLDGQAIFTRNDGTTIIEKWTNGTRLKEEDQIIQDGVNLADLASEPPNQTFSGTSRNLAALMKAFRSGDRFSLFKEREPKQDTQEDFSAAGQKSRLNQSAFLKKIFDSVNYRKK